MPDPSKPDYKDLTITDEAFQNYVRNHNKLTLECLEGESLTPELVVITKNPENMQDEMTLCALAVPFNEKEEKRGILFQIGKKFYDDRQFVMAVILASECWCAKRSKDTDWQDVQPRHDPQRIAAILVAGVGLPDGKQRMVITTPIRRDEKNNMVIDGESDEALGGEFFLISHFWRGYLSQVKR